MVEYRLPPELAERARQFAEEGGVPAAPRLASTVVLLREPFEAYLIRRVATMAFAASMYVFPGGGVDPRDAAGQPGWGRPPPAQVAARLGAGQSGGRAGAFAGGA